MILFCIILPVATISPTYRVLASAYGEQAKQYFSTHFERKQNMNLKLITTEKFNNLDCNFYRNTNDDILLTREQIGTALEYSNPSNAIALIHKRHSDRLDNLSACVKLTTPSGVQNTFVYTERGVMEICRWSNSDQANLFMDFVWEVMDRLIKGELINDNSVINQLLERNQNMIQSMIQSQNTMISLLTTITSSLPQPYKPPFTRWITNTYRKVDKIAEYRNITRRQALNDLYTEFQDTYDLDLNEYQSDYCAAHDIAQASTINVIDADTPLKQLFEIILDTNTPINEDEVTKLDLGSQLTISQA